MTARWVPFSTLGAPPNLVPVPAWLLSSVDAIPVDLFVLGRGRPILYATRGAPTRPLRDRLARGLLLWSEPLRADRLISTILAGLARGVGDRLAPPAARGQVVRDALRALYDVAWAALSREPHDPTSGASSSERAGTRAIVAGLVAAADLVGPLLEDPSGLRAVLESRRAPQGPVATVADRSIDGALYATLLAVRLDILAPGERTGSSLLASMLARDLPLLALPPRRSSFEPHPLEAAEHLGAILGPHSIGVRVVARHHERPDGTGYPCGLSGASLSKLDLVGAAADAATGILLAGGIGAPGTSEAATLVRMALDRRFPGEIASALADIIAELGPARNTQRPA